MAESGWLDRRRQATDGHRASFGQVGARGQPHFSPAPRARGNRLDVARDRSTKAA